MGAYQTIGCLFDSLILKVPYALCPNVYRLVAAPRRTTKSSAAPQCIDIFF
jgi:hypothetical protein